MYDVLHQVRPQLTERAETLLPSLGLAPGQFVLATIHRAANTDDPQTMGRIAQALNAIPLPVVFPIHPRTRKLMEQYGTRLASTVQQIDPVGYLDMLTLEHTAQRVATDSGGIQKEAFLLGVPCVTLRDTTEWPETVEAGWNVLVGSDPDAIVAALKRPPPPPPSGSPFGAGDAALRIAESLCRWERHA
jgi:UDP-GlcNAc3NAcA epimerase